MEKKVRQETGLNRRSSKCTIKPVIIFQVNYRNELVEIA